MKKSVSLILLLLLLISVAAVGMHHHEDGTSHACCALCAFNMCKSETPALSFSFEVVNPLEIRYTPVPLHEPHTEVVQIQSSGRAPPVVL